MQEMYEIYNEDGKLILVTDSPAWQDYDPVVQSFYSVTEDQAQAIYVPQEDAEPFYANIKGRESFSWLQRTVTVKKSS